MEQQLWGLDFIFDLLVYLTERSSKPARVRHLEMVQIQTLDSLVECRRSVHMEEDRRTSCSSAYRRLCNERR